MPTMGVFLMFEFYKYMKDDSDSITTRLDTIFMTVNMPMRDQLGRRDTNDLTLIQMEKGIACLIDSRLTPFGF
jgi:hypothetical protein